MKKDTHEKSSKYENILHCSLLLCTITPAFWHFSLIYHRHNKQSFKCRLSGNKCNSIFGSCMNSFQVYKLKCKLQTLLQKKNRKKNNSHWVIVSRWMSDLHVENTLSDHLPPGPQRKTLSRHFLLCYTWGQAGWVVTWETGAHTHECTCSLPYFTCGGLCGKWPTYWGSSSFSSPIHPANPNPHQRSS